MKDRQDIAAQSARLENLLEARLGARRGSLAERTAKLGRTLPRSVRRDIATVAEAAQLSGHPKLSLRIDPDRVSKATRRAERHLRAVDPGYERRGRLLGMLAGLVVNLGLAFVLMLALLKWRGFL